MAQKQQQALAAVSAVPDGNATTSSRLLDDYLTREQACGRAEIVPLVVV
jgi:hypothetical protein